MTLEDVTLLPIFAFVALLLQVLFRMFRISLLFLPALLIEIQILVGAR